MAYSLERNREKTNEIKKNIETKKGELASLEENKKALLDAGTDVMGSEIDEEAQRKVMDLINSELEANSEKGKELSSEMSSDMSTLDSMKDENQRSLESNVEERSKLEQKKSLLERFGLGGKLEQSISELDDNRQRLDEFNSDLIETEKELSDTSSKLSML